MGFSSCGFLPGPDSSGGFRAVYASIPGESILHAMQVFTLEQIARSASMDNAITSETTRPKRKCIEVPSTLDIPSLNFSQCVRIHPGSKLAQLLAYIQCFSGESVQGIRFA